MIELGSKVRDKLTGFTGIVNARAVYLAGCVRIEVAPPLDKDGKMQEMVWFDEARLELVPEAPVMAAAPAATGGDVAGPPARDPVR